MCILVTRQNDWKSIVIPKPYEKYVLNNGLAVAAIYEPHPFRNIVIKESVKCKRPKQNNLGICERML